MNQVRYTLGLTSDKNFLWLLASLVKLLGSAVNMFPLAFWFHVAMSLVTMAFPTEHLLVLP